MARFRFAVTPRRWDREKQLWTDGHTSFYTVWAWRTLASNLSGSVAVGEPLVVHGRLKVREEEREGQRRTFVDIEAVAVGHDLTRGTSAFRRVVRGEPGLMSRTGGPGTAEPDRWAVREAQEPDAGEAGQAGQAGPVRPEGPADLAVSARRARRVEPADVPARPAGRRRTVRQKPASDLVPSP